MSHGLRRWLLRWWTTGVQGESHYQSVAHKWWNVLTRWVTFLTCTNADRHLSPSLQPRQQRSQQHKAANEKRRTHTEEAAGAHICKSDANIVTKPSLCETNTICCRLALSSDTGQFSWLFNEAVCFIFSPTDWATADTVSVPVLHRHRICARICK